MAEPQITAYMHCSKCLEERPADQSPQEFADLSVGFTREGLQVFCNRHQLNVVHIDFQGVRHPALMDVEGKFNG